MFDNEETLRGSESEEIQPRLRNFIDGDFLDPVAGEEIDDVDPARGVPYARVPDSTDADVDRAVTAAQLAFPSWSRTPAEERSRILLRIADRIDQDRDRLARWECIDNGKPIRLARDLDIPRAAKNIRFFATAILHGHSEFHRSEALSALNYTLRGPRGVAGLISPWNLPLYLFTWKVAPALATGNVAVAKPSEITPMTASLFAQICREEGLPAGVLNVVHGRGARAGAALVAHPKVSTISFTGGTATGRAIAASAAPLFKKISLELGGKNPTLVFQDVDLESVVPECVRAAFSNQGQICLCGSRIFVHREIYDRFVEKFVTAAKSLVIGDPLLESTQQGALVSKPHLEKVRSYVALAKEEGGEIHCGGQAPPTINERCREGFFFEPTVITGLDQNCRVNREEIFGPVATILPFEDEDSVLAAANSTDYGLSASVWTQDLDRAHRVADRLDVGTVWVNCWLLRDLRVPFGGMKKSGVGREGGDEALRFFTEPKNVCLRISPGDDPRP